MQAVTGIGAYQTRRTYSADAKRVSLHVDRIDRIGNVVRLIARAGQVRAVAGLSTVLALLLALHLIRPSGGGLWLQTFYEFLHVPIFGIVALALFAATGALSDSRLRQRLALTGAAIFVLGILSEAAQIPGPRDASLDDLASNWLGAGAFLLLAVAAISRQGLEASIRLSCALIGTAMLVLASAELLTVSAAYLERNSRLPVLYSFDAAFGRHFLRLQNASLEVYRDDDDRSWGRVTLQEGAWPGLIFHDLWPDWRGYDALVLEFRSDGKMPLGVNIRVHDRQHLAHQQPYSDRFNYAVTLKPGTRRIRIPLADIETAPQSRSMDLQKIHGLVIFSTRGDAGRAWSVSEIRLE